MKINFGVRLKNPTFWINISISIFGILLTYFGIRWDEITTWSVFFNILLEAVKNPVVVFSILGCIYNAVIDPTTKGLFDSERALNYSKPN